MKYVIKIPALLAMLFILAACDVAPEYRLSGAPINSGGDSLDPEDDFNIVAYFYADRPVSNLRYICSRNGALPISGKTDENGSFVCPRDRRVAFYVGEPTGLLLGAVDLKIFGNRAPIADDGSDDGEADARENVAITPSTLYGSVADYSRNEVANIFQLLRLIDTSVAGASAQDRIIISDDVHAMFSSSPLASNMTASEALKLSPDDFIGLYARENGPIVENALDEGIVLRTGGVPLSPPIPGLRDLVNRSLVAARAGLYRATQIQGGDGTGSNLTRLFVGSMAMLVGRNGQTTGMGYSWEQNFFGPANLFETMSLPAGSTGGLTASGELFNLVFQAQTNADMSITGRFVNDMLFGASTLIDPSRPSNYKIPYNYTFNGNDVGRFTQDDISGQLTMYRQFEALPDLDSDMLGSIVLPAEFGLLYQDYPDGTQVTEAQRANVNGYGGSVNPLRFRVLANGDIVDVPVGKECAAVYDDNGQYRHVTDDAPVALAGQASNIFRENQKTYMTVMLAIYDPQHPQFGFHLGIPALDGAGLDPVAIGLDAPVQLLNKFCNPALSDCQGYVEWFNTEVFYREIAGPLVNTGSTLPDVEDAADHLRKPDYFGRIRDLIYFPCP